MKNMRLAPALLALAALHAAPCAAQNARESSLLYESYAAEAKGDVDSAIGRMAILLATEPEDYLVNYRLGWLFTRAKKYKNAIDHYERAARAAPASVEPWLALTALELSLGDDRRALAAADELLKRDPRSYYGFLRRSAAAQALGEDVVALAATERGLDLYPLDAAFLEKRAVLLNRLGRAAQARAAVERLSLLDPQNSYARSELKN